MGVAIAKMKMIGSTQELHASFIMKAFGGKRLELLLLGGVNALNV
jgi:hypothetical protein